MAWEYKTVKFPVGGLFKNKIDTEAIDSILDEFGAQNWELVSTMSIQGANGFSTEMIFSFKRPATGTESKAIVANPIRIRKTRVDD